MTLRVDARAATFGLLEVSRGILPGGGGTQRLLRMIPVAKAMEIILMVQCIEGSLILHICGNCVEAAQEGVSEKN